MAGPALVVGMLDELVAGGDPAGPALALAVEAELIDGWRVDGAEPDTGGPDQDRIALANLRRTGDVGGLRHNGQGERNRCEQEFQAHAKGPLKMENHNRRGL